MFPHGSPADPKKNAKEEAAKKDIRFYGDNLIKGNFVFRHFILKPDVKAGLRQYNESLKKMAERKVQS